ncbi:hypothetical protein Vretifemale_2822 [Volvox reticuliferus]|uniref:EGF-like domain-containing protein n=1 Tax=Volvox reticuliferus TaxID=1737510 RepID=A0A8J4FIR1_9CHLO|nr:hypothetical protein Vretifemale_2822 [Volvox reticuliferus]
MSTLGSVNGVPVINGSHQRSTNPHRCECPLLWYGLDCSVPFPKPKEQCAAYAHSFMSCGSNDRSQCLNSCNGRGSCDGGFCNCYPGYYGADCALSLGPDGRPELLAGQGYVPRQHGIKIYVYELPPMTNTWVSISRLDRPLVAALMQRLLSSGVRTADGDSADFFFIPLVMRTKGQAATHLKAVVYYIRQHWPWWDRLQGGHRHLLVVPADLGRRSLPEEHLQMTENVTYLTHWGLHSNHSAGRWVESHRPGRDIVLPPLHNADEPIVFSPLHVLNSRHKERTRGLFFAGRICGDGKAPHEGRCDDTKSSFSGNIRQRVSMHHWNRTGWTVANHVKAYTSALSSHTFCLSPSGGGYGRRSVQALIMGCVPVLLGDGLHQPFEPEVDWSQFAVRVPEEDIPHLHHVLEAINESKIEELQGRLWCAAQHMYYSTTYGEVMGEDGRFDAFEMLMEILRMRRDHPDLDPREYTQMDTSFADFIDCKLAPTGGRVALCSQNRLVKASGEPRLRPCRNEHPGLQMRSIHMFYSWPGGAVCGQNWTIAACPRSWI